MSLKRGIASLLIGTLVGSIGMCSRQASANEDGGLFETQLEAYTVNKITKVEVLQKSRDGKIVATGMAAILPELADITILESSVDPVFGDVVHLGLDDDDVNTPSDFWARATELGEAGLVASQMGAAGEGDPALINEDESIYSADDVVGAKRRRTIKKRMTYCYRFVKQYLLKTGKVSNYLPGGSAWMASRYLPAYGFRPTNRGPANAKDGDVCVYKGGSHGHGHIEIKRPAGWWYGYGYSGPINEKVPRQLIGCYVK